MSAAVCIGVMERDSVTVFVACLLYCLWNMRNEMCFRGKASFLEAAFLLNLSVEEFAEEPCVKPVIIRKLAPSAYAAEVLALGWSISEALG